MTSYQRNRVLPLFAINALLVLIYAVQKTIFGQEVTLTNVVLSFFYGETVVSFGWYLLCIMALYELFYLSGRFCRKHICLSITVMVLLYMALAKALKMYPWTYQSCLAFPAGVIFARYKKLIDTVVRRHQVSALLLFLALYISSFFFLFEAQDEHSSLVNFPLFSLLNSFVISAHGVIFVFVVIGILMLRKCSQKPFGITRRLSDIYLEIYVMQGLAFALFRNQWWSVGNDCLYAVLAVLLTLTLATAIRPLFMKIISLVKIQNV